MGRWAMTRRHDAPPATAGLSSAAESERCMRPATAEAQSRLRDESGWGTGIVPAGVRHYIPPNRSFCSYGQTPYCEFRTGRGGRPF